MPSPKPGNFCVYTTVAIDLDDLVQTLNKGEFGNSPSQTQYAASPDSFLHQPVSAIVNHHSTSTGVFNKQYHVIADRADWSTSGILAVNLDFEGFVDAARMKASDAGDAIPSASILNSEWYEILGSSTGDMYPKEAFAVYASEAIVGKVEKEAKLLEALNAGLESRKDYSVKVCRLATLSLPASKGTEGTDDEIDISPVAKEHTQIATDEGFDSATFIVADEADWDQYGVLVARIAEDGTGLNSCRRPVDVAAEMLTWVHQGLYLWEEGKVWDDEKCIIEED